MFVFWMKCICIFSINIIGFDNNSALYFNGTIDNSLAFTGHEPDIRTETGSQGSKMLVIDGHKFHRYGGRNRKVSFFCHAYRTLGWAAHLFACDFRKTSSQMTISF